MSKAFPTAATTRLDLSDRLEPGDWVQIKEKFTMGDRAAINQAIVEGGITQREETDHTTGRRSKRTEMGQLTLGRSNIVTLVRAIVAWGGPSFCRTNHEADGSTHYEDDQNNGCRPQPITEQVIMGMDDSLGSYLTSEVEKRNPRPSEEEDAHP